MTARRPLHRPGPGHVRARVSALWRNSLLQEELCSPLWVARLRWEPSDTGLAAPSAAVAVSSLLQPSKVQRPARSELGFVFIWFLKAAKYPSERGAGARRGQPAPSFLPHANVRGHGLQP